ncbi:MAG TPA: ferredoxin [Acidimicrobiia bacterium]|nr:ferredoxin [Acidimicrobiia bacterium]
MKLHVDPAKCFGHGLCIEDTPDLFEWNEAGDKAVAIGEVPEGRESKAQEAIRCCPEQAIVVLDG